MNSFHQDEQFKVIDAEIEEYTNQINILANEGECCQHGGIFLADSRFLIKKCGKINTLNSSSVS